jgi:hypothetical protein
MHVFRPANQRIAALKPFWIYNFLWKMGRDIKIKGKSLSKANKKFDTFLISK